MGGGEELEVLVEEKLRKWGGEYYKGGLLTGFVFLGISLSACMGHLRPLAGRAIPPIGKEHLPFCHSICFDF